MYDVCILSVFHAVSILKVDKEVPPPAHTLFYYVISVVSQPQPRIVQPGRRGRLIIVRACGICIDSGGIMNIQSYK